MSEKGFVLAFIPLILVATIVLVLGAWYFQGTDGVVKKIDRFITKTSPLPTTLSPETSDDIDPGASSGVVKVPELYPEVEWEPQDDSESLNEIEYWYEPTSLKRYQVNGKAWVHIGEYSEEDVSELISKFNDYYANNLDKSWVKKYSWQGKVYYPFRADGPAGSAGGYLNVSNGNLRVINLSHENFGPFTFPEGAPPEEDCPCTLKFSVFVSDPVPLEEISSN